MRIDFKTLSHADRCLAICSDLLEDALAGPEGVRVPVQRIQNAFCTGLGYSSYSALQQILTSRNREEPSEIRRADLIPAVERGLHFALSVAKEQGFSLEPASIDPAQLAEAAGSQFLKWRASLPAPTAGNIRAIHAPRIVTVPRELIMSGFFGVQQSTNNQRDIEYESLKDGTLRCTSVIIRSSSESRLPSASDQDKFLAFLHIMQDSLGTLRYRNPFQFSADHMLQLLGQQESRRNFEDVQKWGHCLCGATINVTMNVFQLVEGEKPKNIGSSEGSFCLLQAFSFDETTGESTVKLSDWFLKSLAAEHVVKVDYTQYSRLTRPIAKLLYCWILTLFTGQNANQTQIGYDSLCQRLQLIPQKTARSIRKQIGPGLDELLSVGLLTDWSVDASKHSAQWSLNLVS